MSSNVSTGIKVLDEILQGGFLKSQIILIAGNPGAGKTTFGTQFIYEGIRRGEPGIYVGFVEPKEDYLDYMERMGFKLREAERDGKFLFIEALTIRDKAALEALTLQIFKMIKKMKAKRLVLDSISTLEALFTSDLDARAFLHNILLRSLKREGVTTLLISDLPYGESVIGRGIEEFVFDGVIVLEQVLEMGLPRRRLIIKKLRGKAVPTSHYDFIIGDNGIELIPPLIPTLRGLLREELLSTGIKQLDEMLGGGIRVGSVTLVVGPSGAGKTVLATSFIAEGIKNGERGAYLSHEESPEQIHDYLRRYGVERDEKLLVLSKNVMAQTPYELYSTKRKIVYEFKPKRFVIDGVTVLKRVLGEENFISLMRMVVSDCKKNGITLLVTMIGDPFRERIGISTIVDNLIALSLEREGDELVRKMGVIKARGSKTSKHLAAFTFDERGKIVVGG